MFGEILSRFERKYGPASMARIKGMLAETPKDRGRRNPLQAQAMYILPDLSENMLFSLEKYPDLWHARNRFMERHSEIRREILNYLELIGRPECHGGYGKLGGEQWRVVFLNRVGMEDVGVAPHFPQTANYINDCGPILYPVAGISFSILEPGGHIKPHNDRTNVFIHFHQSVVTPPDCGLRVGGNEIVFEEGESYLFDPSFVHEAWNKSARDRIHLILPVWHPDTTSEEREALAEVFQLLRDLSAAKTAS